jgi:hypothetical protein
MVSNRFPFYSFPALPSCSFILTLTHISALFLLCLVFLANEIANIDQSLLQFLELPKKLSLALQTFAAKPQYTQIPNNFASFIASSASAPSVSTSVSSVSSTPSSSSSSSQSITRASSSTPPISRQPSSQQQQQNGHSHLVTVKSDEKDELKSGEDESANVDEVQVENFSQDTSRASFEHLKKMVFVPLSLFVLSFCRRFCSPSHLPFPSVLYISLCSRLNTFFILPMVTMSMWYNSWKPF